MIHYLTTSGHQYPWRSPLEDPRAPVATREELLSRVRLISYERLFRMRVLPAGSYVFADLDRLGVEATERAALLRRVLQEGGPGIRVFNDPIRSMRRFELLRHLYARGLNAFNVYRLTDVSQVRRFPVFLRNEDGHSRPWTERDGGSDDGRVRAGQAPGDLSDQIEQRIVETHLGPAPRPPTAARAHAHRGQPEQPSALPALSAEAARQVVAGMKPPRSVSPAQLLDEEVPRRGAVAVEDDRGGRVAQGQAGLEEPPADVLILSGGEPRIEPADAREHVPPEGDVGRDRVRPGRRQRRVLPAALAQGHVLLAGSAANIRSVNGAVGDGTTASPKTRE